VRQIVETGVKVEKMDKTHALTRFGFKRCAEHLDGQIPESGNDKRPLSNAFRVTTAPEWKRTT